MTKQAKMIITFSELWKLTKLTAIQGAFIQKQNKNKIWILVGTASFVTFQLSLFPYFLPSSALVLKTNSQQSRRKSAA